VFGIRSRHLEVFDNLPTTVEALRYDVTNGEAQHWFSSAELKSLNISEPVDFVFASELYMMKEIINTVCVIVVWSSMLDSIEQVSINESAKQFAAVILKGSLSACPVTCC